MITGINQASIVVKEYKEKSDEFGIVEFGEFKRLDSTFDYIFVHVNTTSKKHKSIYVKCPKCGRIGRLVVRKNKPLSGRVYRIKHKPNRKLTACQWCSIGILDKHYEFFNSIYEKCRGNSNKGRGDE